MTADTQKWTVTRWAIRHGRWLAPGALAAVALAAWLGLRTHPVPQAPIHEPARAVDAQEAVESALPPLPEVRPPQARPALNLAGRGAAEPLFIAPTGLLPEPWPGSEYEPAEYARGKIDIFLSFQAASEDWTIETFADRVARVGELNGRQAYEVYAYLRACFNYPTSPEALDRRTERVVSGNDRSRRGMDPDELAQWQERMKRGLVRCEGLPERDEQVAMMMGWLTLAAERGFPQAQMAYHKSIRWLLTTTFMGPYRYPDQVHEYRRLAPLFLEAALSSGHADAFNEYSIALREHVVFPEDPVAAYAYAYAATLAADAQGREAVQEAEAAMTSLEAVLTPAQQRDARELGRALCKQYCRGA